MGDYFYSLIFYYLLFSIFSFLVHKQLQFKYTILNSLREHVCEINCYFACFKNVHFLVILTVSFMAKICIPRKPQFYYIKVGVECVLIT